MPILLILSAFFSGFVYSEETTETQARSSAEGIRETVSYRWQSIAGSLKSVFQMNSESDLTSIHQKDTNLENTILNMQVCTHKNTLTDRLKSAFVPTCKKVIHAARERLHISNFLLETAVKKSALEEERKQVLMDLLAETRDPAEICQCEKPDFATPVEIIVRHKHTHSTRIRELHAYRMCSAKMFVTDPQVTCNHFENFPAEAKDLISYLQSQMKTCTLEGHEPEFPNSFRCKDLVKEAKKLGLSYFEVRYALEEGLEELEYDWLSNLKRHNDRVASQNENEQLWRKAKKNPVKK